MKCYYSYDNEIGKFIVPQCYAVMHSDDISDCTCSGYYYQFEKLKRYEGI